MTKNNTAKPVPDVDKKTAQGAGEGGFAPHPAQPTNEKAPPLDPHSYKVPSSGDDAKAPDDNDEPIPAQRSSTIKGTGHANAEGGLPEKQPSKREQ